MQSLLLHIEQHQNDFHYFQATTFFLAAQTDMNCSLLVGPRIGAMASRQSVSQSVLGWFGGRFARCRPPDKASLWIVSLRSNGFGLTLDPNLPNYLNNLYPSLRKSNKKYLNPTYESA